jgi:hypothetical protein
VRKPLGRIMPTQGKSGSGATTSSGTKERAIHTRSFSREVVYSSNPDAFPSRSLGQDSAVPRFPEPPARFHEPQSPGSRAVKTMSSLQRSTEIQESWIMWVSHETSMNSFAITPGQLAIRQETSDYYRCRISEAPWKRCQRVIEQTSIELMSLRVWRHWSYLIS